MKRFRLVIVLAFLSIIARAQDDCEIYVRKYSDMAVEEMYRSGVPASITLAQGILESGRGKSTLATNANNHFGIKCHKWDGDKVYHDDDKPQECFRKYDSVAESFKDHSDFLRYHDRYKFLFDLEPTDYKGWAYGLKKAGYATSPTYAEKLISLIERYELFRFDVSEETEETETVEPETVEPETALTETAPETKPEQKTTRTSTRTSTRTTNRTTSKAADRTSTRTPKRTEPSRSRRLPESPSQMERMRLADGFAFSLSRQVFKKNDVACVIATAGETYSSIAAEYDLFLKEILKFNDVSADAELLPGQIVYIRAKKKMTEPGLDKHICESSEETLWQISQRYGVKLANLLKINGLTGNEPLCEDCVILLRPRK